MPDILTKFPEQLKEFWNNLDKSNRTKLIVMSSVIFTCVIIAIIILTRPTYTVLISSINSNEIKEVLTQLDSSNIEYRIGEGNSIKVKQNDLNKAKASLLQEGLPKGGVTLSDYDMTKLGTTDKQRQRLYKEYKERDLAATLKEYRNINSAVVKLSMPEQSNFFGGQENKAKASVAIDSNTTLSEKQIKGIERFIAGSVEGLEPDNVTILDNNANILNDGFNNDTIANNIDRQYVMKQKIKEGVEKQVKELLSGVADNVRVMANLDIDFDSLVQNKEVYEPVIDEQGIIISKAVKSETVTNGTSTGGVPGTDSNPPTYPNNTSTENGGEYELTDEAYNYEVNKTVSTFTKEIGKIIEENSSIALALYYVQHEDASNNTNDNKANTEQIIKIVSSATGIPEENVAINIFDIPSKVQEQRHYINVFTFVETFGPMLIMTVLIVLIAIAILKRRNEFQLQEGEAAVETIRKETKDKNKEDYEELEFEEKSEIKKQIDNFVSKKPEAVAQLLRNWLAEDW